MRDPLRASRRDGSLCASPLRHARGAERGRAGAILVTVLITGTALLLLALAGCTLALLHLHAARYAETAQRARIVARSGIELIDAVLAERIAARGTLPLAPPSLPDGHGMDLRVTGYERLGPRTAEVEVEGRSDGAAASAGARLAYP